MRFSAVLKLFSLLGLTFLMFGTGAHSKDIDGGRVLDREVYETCAYNTKTEANARYCISVESNVAITKSCYTFTRSERNEKQCLRGQVPTEISEACFVNSLTEQNEGYCLRLRLNPQDAITCHLTHQKPEYEYVCFGRAANLK